MRKNTICSKFQPHEYKKLSFKVKKAELDLNFLSNCCLFNFKKRQSFWRSIPYTQLIRRRLFRSAIMKREDKLYKLGKEFKKNYVQVCSVLNVIDQYIISSLMKKSVKAMVKLTILTHEQKLHNLTQTLYTSTDTVLNLSF